MGKWFILVDALHLSAVFHRLAYRSIWPRFDSGSGVAREFRQRTEDHQLLSLFPMLILELSYDNGRHGRGSEIVSRRIGGSPTSQWLLENNFPAKANRSQVSAATWRRNVTSWVYVPTGLLLMLLACFGVNSLIGLGSDSFPASVACMIVLFFALIACDSIIGDRRTRQVVHVIDIPVC